MLSKKVFSRLEMQLKEAKELNFTKLANNLEQAIKSETERNSDSSYAFAELQTDVENLLWKTAVRTADYYDVAPDCQSLQPLIEQFAFEFISTFNKISNTPLIGKFEPKVPGEK